MDVRCFGLAKEVIMSQESSEASEELCIIKPFLAEAALLSRFAAEDSDIPEAIRPAWVKAAAALLCEAEIPKQVIIDFLGASPEQQDAIEIPGGLQFERFVRLVTQAKRQSLLPPPVGRVCACGLSSRDCVHQSVPPDSSR